MTTLSRFLSRGAEGRLPFFKILRKVEGFLWNKECQEAFDNLKEYLSTPPLLTKPRSGEKVYIYLSISEEAVSPHREVSTSIDSGDKKTTPILSISSSDNIDESVPKIYSSKPKRLWKNEQVGGGIE
ncbi:UNVERIFIED_CONTAM: hypothetical protein Slati_0206700 [Sesamum latifolium]|uniref:Reverse transcriptase/retrotransposon-derived protein RNase H-like domain-containing protein n=1 Tax=Sesamum latifolium TaxID=2727402 RepID=A0AAW2YBZ6_9LAMI